MKSALVALLLDARGAALCDDCIGRALGFDGRAVTRVASELSVSPDYLRDSWACSRCRRRRVVTQAVITPHVLPFGLREKKVS